MMRKILKVFLWGVAIIVTAYIILVIARIPHAIEKQKTDEQVAKIHATKLALDDVMGKNLPPDPGADADTTVQGVDVNHNGIRDDVELAIFKAYPTSAKTRAALLQYALALQMEVVQVIVNTGTVIASVQEEDRAYLCVGKILSRNDMERYVQEGEKLRSFVKEKQLNTTERKRARKDFFEKIGSYESLDRVCDIDYSKLPN